MFQRIAVLCLLTFFVLGRISASHAGDVVWDDNGGSASKLWSDNSNWAPNGQPGAADDVFVGVTGNDGFSHPDATGDVTLLDQSYTINSLKIGNAADVVNSPDSGATTYQLNVNNNTFVGGGFSGTSEIILYDAPSGFLTASLITDTLSIGNNGKVVLDSLKNPASQDATLFINGDGLAIQTGGELAGNGQIALFDSPASSDVLFRNDGTITAENVGQSILGLGPAQSTLKILASSSNARFDWDGNSDSGVVNINGNATLDVDVETDGFSGTMNLATGSTLDVAHAWTSFVGGQFNVNTQDFGIVFPGNDPNPGAAAVIAGANFFHFDGTISLADSWDTLQFDAELNALGTIDNSGTIVFNANANIQNNLNMNGGGASLVVNAVVDIFMPDFNLDGAGQFGNVTTINSGGILNLELGAGADENFDHTINMNGGSLSVKTSDNTWSLTALGEINAAGGATSIINGEILDIFGNINITANSSLEFASPLGTRFKSSSQVFIEAGSNITVQRPTSVEAGAIFTGGGSLVNSTVGLSLFDGADVDVLLENQGKLFLGRQTTGKDFEQTAAGTLDLDIGGLGLNDFDSMSLTGTALLDGILDLSLDMGFIPSLGDTFDILSAAGGVTGIFDSVLQPGAMPSGLLFDVNYLGSIVQLEVVNFLLFSADFDNDGDVDGDDLAQWESDFGGPGSDADDDGDSDGLDFLAWQQQFGSSLPPALQSLTTSVPEPSTLFLTCLAASFGLLMPRRQKKACSHER